MPLPSFSVVVETDNVELDELDALTACLDSIGRQQPLLARADGVLLVDGGKLPATLVETLRATYPWLTIAPTAPAALYIAHKAAGAAHSASEVVVFCDSDIRYEAGWLEALLTPFDGRPDVEIVGGETTTPIGGPFSLAIALTFVFPRFTGESELAPSPTYWANNVAIRRTVLERSPIPDPAVLYRGQNILHSLDLTRSGKTIWRQPRARAQHVVLRPGAVAGRYLALGRDSLSVARLTRAASGATYLAAMAPDVSGGRRLRKLAGRIRQVARSAPRDLAWLPLALPMVGLLGLCYLAGRLSGAAAPAR
jgi:hypothetical protein